jgi:hypothetical protein
MGKGEWYVRKREMYRGFWWGLLKERGHLKMRPKCQYNINIEKELGWEREDWIYV